MNGVIESKMNEPHMSACDHDTNTFELFPDTIFTDLSTNNDEYTNPPILLIDSSGSVKDRFVNETIFDKMLDISRNINSKFFRFIFWNSNTYRYNDKLFTNGIYKPVSCFSRDKIHQLFKFVSSNINGQCLTYPDLGFDSIPDEWISNTTPTHIYLITDGCMSDKGYQYQQHFKTVIDKLVKNHNNIHLHLITVENRSFDFNQNEIFNQIAGSDVFTMFQKTGLTNFISEFISYSPKYLDGYTHIKRMILPTGYSEFMGRAFSLTKADEFLHYLKNLITKTNTEVDAEDKLLRIIQDLTITLKHLSIDKSPQQTIGLTNMICNMFRNTVIDSSIVKSIFIDASQSELQGKAIVFSEYRTRLKDLYKQANSMLMQNVKNAINMNYNVLSLPYPNVLNDETIENVIVSGYLDMVTHSFNIHGKNMPESCMKVNNILLPVFSLDNTNELTQINEQCLRQYIRSIISKQYGCDAMSDYVIYIILALMMQVVCSSDISIQIKETYRKLAYVMLNKKRLNSNITELEWLKQGNAPIPNSKSITDFHKYMNDISTLFNFSSLLDSNVKLNPMTIWYAMCIALNDNDLIVKQLIHCNQDIDTDFKNIQPIDIINCIKMNKIVNKQMPEADLYDYKCMVTLDDCTHTGGYKINPHETVSGYICNPNNIFSQQGYDALMSNPPVRCVICFTHLYETSFDKIEPKQELTIDIFSDKTKNIFSSQQQTSYNAVPNIQNKRRQKNQIIKTPLGNVGNLIVMSGTVGSGKSTYSNKLKELIEQMGGKCVIASPDNYCKTGMHIAEACKRVSKDLDEIVNDTTGMKPLVAIIDTCGDTNRRGYFEHYFDGWNKITVSPNLNKRNQNGYLMWSLRNVLMRSQSSIDTPYNLNPISTSYKICLDVHKKKAKHIVGKKTPMPYNDNLTIDQLLNSIDNEATEYQNYLNEHMKIDDELDKIMKKLI